MMLSVFGPVLGTEKQALVALLIILLCIVGEVHGKPFSEKTVRHKVLNVLEIVSVLS